MAIYDSCGFYIISFALLGFVVLILFLLDTIWGIVQGIRAILAPFFIPNEEQSLAKRYGQWALVTGCTDGIGKEYAKELAKRGLDIVLISRTEEKLKTTAREIETQFSVKTKIIAADFSDGPKAIEKIKEELGCLNIGILVNNVGKQYSYPMYVGEVPEKELWDIININIGAVTLMTRLIVEGMKERGRGAIVNVSSGSELQPMPLMTVYAASKVYIRSFTEALRYEYSKHGVTVQHLSPLFINTKMNDFSTSLRETSVFVPDAKTYAKHAVRTLGKIDKTTGYWSHGIQYFFTTIPPVWFRMHVAAFLNKAFRQEYYMKSTKA